MQSKDFLQLFFNSRSVFILLPPAPPKLDCESWICKAVAIYNPILKLKTSSIVVWPKGQGQCYGDKHLHILKKRAIPGHTVKKKKKCSARIDKHLLLMGAFLAYLIGNMYT